MTTPTNDVGRPPVGPRVEIRLPESVLRTLDDHAEQTGTTRAATLRTILTAWAEGTIAPAMIGYLNPGSVIRCECGCGNVSVRAQDGDWIHAESIAHGEPGRGEDIAEDKPWIRHRVLHRSIDCPVPDADEDDDLDEDLDTALDNLIITP